MPVMRPSWTTRRWITVVAVIAAMFHLFSAGWIPLTALVQRPLHLALMATLGFAGVGIRKRLGPGASESPTEPRGLLGWPLSGVLIGAAWGSCLYLVSQHQALVARAGNAARSDIVAGVVALVLVLELTRRATGWGLVSVALLALAYSQLGPWLPGALAHRGYSPTRVIEHLYLSTEGIWGIPLGVSADFVYLFILFGALLDKAGGGELLIGLARRVAGNSRGGPAKTAAVSSALMGSLSGSAVANVVTTGSITIPMMKRAGFPAHLAGAIEAAASTGGQIMPPVMGAGAFILATWTNIPYLTVATAAVVPALLYYVALLVSIHFAAGRAGLSADDTPFDAAGMWRRIHLLLPLVAIVVMLALGRSPMRAAFWGVVFAAVMTMARPATRLRPRQIGATLLAAGSGAVQVAAACATAGIVVGVATLTGIGLRMSELIVTLSAGQLPVALLLTAVGSIVLGMGLPTTAAYIVLAALGAPALVQLGAPLLAAHLFIFYFGCISNITPPVSLAAYAAAGLSGAPPFRTALWAMALAATGFVVPFIFIFEPGLLLTAGAAHNTMAVVRSLGGVTALAAAAVGYHKRSLPVWERLVLAGAALALLLPGGLTNVAGLLLLLASWFRPTGNLHETP